MHRATLLGAAFSPDGKFLATVAGETSPYASQMGNVNCEVKLWDSQGTPLGDLHGPGSTIFCLAISPDSQTLVTAGMEGKIKFWDPITRKEKSSAISYSPEGIMSLAFSRDGKYLVAGSKLGNIQIWDTGTWQTVATPKTSHESRVNTIAFSPNGKLLASASDDGSVKLWDTSTWKEKGELKVDNKGVLAAAFGSDDAILVTGHQDGKVRFWDVDKQTQKSHSSDIRKRFESMSFNVSTHRFVRISGLSALTIVIAVSWGCGPKPVPVVEKDREHILKALNVFNEYRKSHNNKSPSNTEELITWGKQNLKKEKLQQMGLEDVESALTSPNDGQHYVVLPPAGPTKGASPQMAGMMQTIMEEKVGVNGKRLTVSGMGSVSSYEVKANSP